MKSTLSVGRSPRESPEAGYTLVPARGTLVSMFQARTRTANAALTLLDICAWTYALTATLHAIA
jgi:hypothetical protein